MSEFLEALRLKKFLLLSNTYFIFGPRFEVEGGYVKKFYFLCDKRDTDVLQRGDI